MPAQLVISDGPQWWRSPDIFTTMTPGPIGLPSPPIAGIPIYVGAYVSNIGDTDASGVRLHFWWSEPTTRVLADDSKHIGEIGYLSIKAGEMKQRVVCPKTWTPQFGNGGHVCLVAFADDVTSPFHGEHAKTGFDLDPRRYREVAQRNITVLSGPASVPVIKIWDLVGGEAESVKRSLHAEAGGALDEAQLAQLGLEGYRIGKKPRLEIFLCRAGRPQPRDRPEASDSGFVVSAAPGHPSGVEVHIDAPGLGPREYAVVDIVERQSREVVGGCAFVVVPERHESKPDDCAYFILSDPE